MPFPDHVPALRQLIAEVMDVESVMLGGEQGQTLRVAGRLRQPAHEAFAHLRPRFEELGHTPLMRRENDQDVIIALHQVFKPEVGSPWPNIILFLLTVVSVLVTGTLYDVLPPVTVDKLMASLPTGILFTISMLGILGTHEMGHYLMARRYGVRVTLPYFIPIPTILGTMGAVIAMKEPPPNRRVQFDIGVAGPLAGLVVAVPVLIAGLLMSDVLTQAEILATLPEGVGISQEGNSLLYLAIKYLVFGKVLPSPAGEDVFIHAVAFAGWAGLLVTALNLVPIGQLDGGHVLYGLLGERAQKLRWPIILVMLGLGFFYQGWILWAFLVLLLTRRSAVVLDEITELDAPRRWVAIGVLVIFVLIFVPVPLKAVPLP